MSRFHALQDDGYPPQPVTSSLIEVVEVIIIDRTPNRPGIIVLVIDDSEDDAIVAAAAGETEYPSAHFGGHWRRAIQNDERIVAFRLAGPGRSGEPITRTWWTARYDVKLLTAILEVPHVVALLSDELLPDERTPTAIAAALGGALMILAEQ